MEATKRVEEKRQMKDFKDLQKVMEGRRGNTLKQKVELEEEFEEGEEAKGQHE